MNRALVAELPSPRFLLNLGQLKVLADLIIDLGRRLDESLPEPEPERDKEKEIFCLAVSQELMKLKNYQSRGGLTLGLNEAAIIEGWYAEGIAIDLVVGVMRDWDAQKPSYKVSSPAFFDNVIRERCRALGLRGGGVPEVRDADVP